MTDDVVTVSETTPSTDVARLLDRHGISGLPVIDRDDKVLGVVSASDLVRARAARWPDVTGEPPAREVMSTPAVTVHPEQRVPDAARLMERRGVERLPVVDEEDRLIGIVTRRDLLRVFLRGDDEIRRQVREEIVAGELGLPPDAVGVSVRDGVVTLAGGAELRGAIARAGFAAWRLDGVVGVVNLVPPVPPQEVARPG
ncbi:CBS domain-containing protein [Streptomyces misionensis]|uniref:CBS domain-containing protein n=1 Tax=Streptomyces misionensis TaxID=67331 RepID=A0A5C6K0H1_9ACTN|nr:CBS domain-containing protein [Streptomyces misionensis]TWV55949.1 CBS domain-containing protein [Streptomyces misionensis]